MTGSDTLDFIISLIGIVLTTVAARYGWVMTMTKKPPEPTPEPANQPTPTPEEKRGQP